MLCGVPGVDLDLAARSPDLLRTPGVLFAVDRDLADIDFLAEIFCLEYLHNVLMRIKLTDTGVCTYYRMSSHTCCWNRTQENLQICECNMTMNDNEIYFQFVQIIII